MMEEEEEVDPAVTFPYFSFSVEGYARGDGG